MIFGKKDDAIDSRTRRIEEATNRHKERYGEKITSPVYKKKKRRFSFGFFLNFFVLLGVLFIYSGAYSSIETWREHTLIIKVDPSRKIIDPVANLSAYDFRQIDCLARNMYFEAANQGQRGMKAVGDVVYNRLRSGLYPDGICQIVYQSKMTRNSEGILVPVRNRCQFSWYCDGKPKRITDTVRWNMSYEVAYNMYIYNKAMPDLTDGATFYHANYVHPDWSRLKKTTQIGLHLFYKADPGYKHHKKKLKLRDNIF